MILPVMVVGIFETHDGHPLAGRIRFTPRDLWVEHDGQHYATLSDDLELVNGAFSVILTPDVPYKVWTPYGIWKIVPSTRPVQRLVDLLPQKKTTE